MNSEEQRKCHTDLVPNYQRVTTRSPGQSEGFTKTPDFIETVLCPNIPEFHSTINADAAKFCILDWIEGHLLNLGRVTLEICRETGIGLFWVPYPSIRTSQQGLRVMGCDPLKSRTRLFISM